MHQIFVNLNLFKFTVVFNRYLTSTRKTAFLLLQETWHKRPFWNKRPVHLQRNHFEVYPNKCQFHIGLVTNSQEKQIIELLGKK